MSRDGWAALPRGATGLSAVFDCGISWSYSLTIFVFDILSSLCLAVLWSSDGKEMISCLSYMWCFLVLSLFHSMFWIRCGTWLYRFLIFAFFLTLVEGIIRNILWNYFYFIGIILNFHISDLEHFLGCSFMIRFEQSSSYIHINVLIRFLPSHFFFQ